MARPVMGGAAGEAVLLVRSGPDTPGGRRALALCAEREARGEPTTLALLGDAVALAREADAAGARVVCVAEDLASRGLSAKRLQNASEVDYGELVDILMAGGPVVGAL